ncbi:Conserved_hypothetical protein [Hexamita inflata]|uniref:Leucine-rich repeat protein n=1 Tax=Hexamita inflata TaxID=28002 RepID=A0AA86NB36_9EUKA|nr:Conserved hypothetical protein [Hexamita inflata]
MDEQVKRFEKYVKNNNLAIEKYNLNNFKFAECLDVTSLEVKGCFNVNLTIPPLNITRLLMVKSKFDLEGIQNMTQLTELYLPCNFLKNISQLQYLVNLKILGLNNNNLRDIRPLGKLKQLETLNIAENKIQNINTLFNLVNLHNIELDKNAVKDNTCFKALNNVTELRMINCQQNNIQSVRYLVNLQILHICRNNIDKITPLSQLHFLRELYISRCNLDNDISALSCLTQLYRIDMDYNRICDITPIRYLVNLEMLCMSNNHITDISILRNLVNLEFVNMSVNYVQDLLPIENLARRDSFVIGLQMQPTPEIINCYLNVRTIFLSKEMNKLAVDKHKSLNKNIIQWRINIDKITLNCLDVSNVNLIKIIQLFQQINNIDDEKVYQ